MKQNPFSFYDFLGYLIPGGVFTVISSFIFLDDFVGVLGIASLKLKGSIFAGSSVVIAVIILFYIVGHLISLLSSSFVERYLNDTYGWPSQYLFAKKNEILSLSLRRYFSEIFSENSKKDSVREIFKHVSIGIVLLPMAFFERLFNRVLGIRPKPLPQRLKLSLLNKMDGFLSTQGLCERNNTISDGCLEGDLFRFVYHYAQENSENHISKMANYVALYGFSRNICFVFVALFWINLLNSDYTLVHLKLSMFFGVSSAVFFYGFEKFYRRYTLEAMMACVSIRQKES